MRNVGKLRAIELTITLLCCPLFVSPTPPPCIFCAHHMTREICEIERPPITASCSSSRTCARHPGHCTCKPSPTPASANSDPHLTNWPSHKTNRAPRPTQRLLLRPGFALRIIPCLRRQRPQHFLLSLLVLILSTPPSPHHSPHNSSTPYLAQSFVPFSSSRCLVSSQLQTPDRSMGYDQNVRTTPAVLSLSLTTNHAFRAMNNHIGGPCLFLKVKGCSRPSIVPSDPYSRNF